MIGSFMSRRPRADGGRRRGCYHIAPQKGSVCGARRVLLDSAPHGRPAPPFHVFGRLPQYESESCWRENPIIRFDTLTEEREYAVMACFYSRIYADNENGFRYYAIFDLTNEADFNYYVTQAKANAIYETGVNAVFGDELIVLSTCSHHVTDGRFAVVAKRIK